MSAEKKYLDVGGKSFMGYQRLALLPQYELICMNKKKISLSPSVCCRYLRIISMDALYIPRLTLLRSLYGHLFYTMDRSSFVIVIWIFFDLTTLLTQFSRKFGGEYKRRYRIA